MLFALRIDIITMPATANTLAITKMIVRNLVHITSTWYSLCFGWFSSLHCRQSRKKAGSRSKLRSQGGPFLCWWFPFGSRSLQERLKLESLWSGVAVRKRAFHKTDSFWYMRIKRVTPQQSQRQKKRRICIGNVLPNTISLVVAAVHKNPSH